MHDAKCQSAFWKLQVAWYYWNIGQGIGEICGGPDPKDCGGIRELGAYPEGDDYPVISGRLGSSQRLSLSLSQDPRSFWASF